MTKLSKRKYRKRKCTESSDVCVPRSGKEILKRVNETNN